MGIIKATAYLNALTKDVTNDYFLLPELLETLDLHAIVERLRSQEIATKNVDGETFTQRVFDEMAIANAEGHNIVTTYFRSTLGLTGAVNAADLGHPISADRVKARLNFTQGEGAKKAISNMSVFVNEQSAASGPVIQSAIDPTNNKSNILTIGGMVLIQGMRIALKGDDASVGITFTKQTSGDDRPVIESDETVFIAPKDVYPNTPSGLQFVLPTDMTEGEWSVTVTTQTSSSSKVFTKQPRSYKFEKTITVKTKQP